ncbi:hypothetical protein ACQ4LE_010890 [Meloidogyne hapla]
MDEVNEEKNKGKEERKEKNRRQPPPPISKAFPGPNPSLLSQPKIVHSVAAFPFPLPYSMCIFPRQAASEDNRWRNIENDQQQKDQHQ